VTDNIDSDLMAKCYPELRALALSMARDARTRALDGKRCA
jgi:hypothetical protein